MLAETDKNLYTWLINARTHGGSFVATLAEAAFHADDDNYTILRPAIQLIAEKYHHYFNME